MIRSQHKLNIETVLYIILLFAIGFWFLLLNWNTPFMHDDLAYHYYYDSNSALERPTSEPITSFWQIFPSMWNHYNAVNGRFTSHLIIQLFCGLLGKSVFNYINTCIFILFCDLIVLLSCGKRKLLPLAIVVVSVMYLLPFPGQTMLWLTGSVNYLWSATFSLIVIKFLIVGGKRSIITTLMLFLFTIFAGWMNESISFGIGGGLVVYFFMHKDRFMGVSRWIVLGYLLGCLMILLSPGTMNRAASGEINTELTILQMVSSRVINSVFLLKDLPILLIVLLLLLVSCFKKFSFLIEGSSLFLLAFLCTALFCFLLGLTDHRVFFGLSVICTLIFVIAVCNSEDHYHINRNTISLITILVLFICLPQGVKAIGKTREYSVYSADVERRILATHSKCVIEAKPISSSRFVYATTVNPNRYQWHNRVRAFYYKKDFVQALPEELYGLLSNKSSFGKTSFWYCTGLDGRSVKTVIYKTLADYSSLSRRQYIARYLLGYLSSEIVQQQWIDFENNGVEYIALPKFDSVEKIVVIMKNGSEYELVPSSDSSPFLNTTISE